jgi:hypothetical protein
MIGCEVKNTHTAVSIVPPPILENIINRGIGKKIG